MWNIMERFSLEFDLEMNLIKKMVKVVRKKFVFIINLSD